MTPTNFRSGGHGASMRFAVGACSLGSILVAATDKGVCAILLSDDPDALVHDLQDRFPKAQLLGGDKNFEHLVAKACASNAIAVAIPCHRIVRQDGTLTGYRWGVERKRALLDREAVS